LRKLALAVGSYMSTSAHISSEQRVRRSLVTVVAGDNYTSSQQRLRLTSSDLVTGCQHPLPEVTVMSFM